MGQFVVMTLKVVITVTLHKPAKVMLAACSGTDDTVATRPVHTSWGFALKHDQQSHLTRKTNRWECEFIRALNCHWSQPLQDFKDFFKFMKQ